MSSALVVSIVLCTRNGERHLAAQLDSLLAQTRGDFELVAVDDASTDGTLQILHGYAGRDPRVRVTLNPVNLGYNHNFAKALAGCRGQFVAPCDQDDVWHLAKLAELVEQIGDADLVYCDSEFVDGYGAPLGARLSASRRMYQGRDPLALIMTNSASGHAMLFRRELLAHAAPFPDGVMYDWWLALAAAAGAGLRYVDRPLVKFRRHAQASTGIARPTPLPRPRPWLEERRVLLHAAARLPGERQEVIAALADALDAGLDRGQWRAAIRLAWRHRAALGYIHSRRLPALLRDALGIDVA